MLSKRRNEGISARHLTPNQISHEIHQTNPATCPNRGYGQHPPPSNSTARNAALASDVNLQRRAWRRCSLLVHSLSVSWQTSCEYDAQQAICRVMPKHMLERIRHALQHMRHTLQIGSDFSLRTKSSWTSSTASPFNIFCKFHYLTLILLTWRIWWTPNNASRWQVGFNSVFKRLTSSKITFRNKFVTFTRTLQVLII